MFGDRRLTKHTIATIKVVDFDLCEMQCYNQPNCVSINFKVLLGSEGLHECELNNATHQSHDNDLQSKKGYLHKGAEVRNFNIPFHFVFNFFFFGVFVFGFDACLWVLFGVGFEHGRVWFRTGFDIGGMRFTLELKLGFVFLSDSRLTSA